MIHIYMNCASYINYSCGQCHLYINITLTHTSIYSCYIPPIHSYTIPPSFNTGESCSPMSI